ncbi:MAG: DUF2460 domain-containing protein [Syntrophaceae bacterium]
MSNVIFPSLPGLKWDQSKIPLFKTRIQTAVSGREVRLSLNQYPRYQFNLSFELLRDDIANDELEALLGFYLARHGAWDSFLYIDPSDHIAVGQTLSPVTGSTTVYQLSRAYGGFSEPILNIQAPGSPTPVLNIYDNGVLVNPSNYSLEQYDAGTIEFIGAPTGPVTADFSYYYRVRFEEYGQGSDDAFAQFAYNLWECRSVTMISQRRETPYVEPVS